MITRLATPADADAIATIHIASWRSAYRGLLPDELLAALDHGQRAALWVSVLTRDRPRSSAFVVESDGVPLGFADLRPRLEVDSDPVTVGEVAAVYVGPAIGAAGRVAR